MFRGREPARDRLAAQTIDHDGHEDICLEPQECDGIAGNHPTRDGNESLVPFLRRDPSGEVLRDLEAFTNLIFDSVGTGIIALDREHRVTAVNRAAEQITGVAVDSAMGKPWTVFGGGVPLAGIEAEIASSMRGSAWREVTLRRAATLADNWIPGPTADLARLLAGKQQFLANRAAAGRTAPITEWPLTRDVIIAETDAQARALAEEHIMVAYRREYAGGWRHPFIDASIATDLDRLMADRFIIGGPEQCVAQIRRFVDRYGMTHLICRTFFPGMPHARIMKELDLIAREVMPAFR